MKNILVLTDFSENSTHAAAYALYFGKKIKANLSLCNAFQQPVAIPEMGGGMSFSAEEYTLVSDNSLLQLNQLKSFLNKQEENHHENGDFYPEINLISSLGNLSDVIKEVILNDNNVLIITGTHDNGGLSDIFLANNVTELIRDINFPLLVIPFNASFEPIDKIGFAIELQNEDLDIVAVRKLVSFAKPLKANIILIHIYNSQEEKHASERHLRRVLKAIGNKDKFPQITTKLFDGKTIEEGLNEVCKSAGIDLLSMVHQHHGFLSRVFSSGHTGHMTDHIHIPLLVLPHEPECVQ
ncbi:universal stress protein [Mucilaginibacter sp. UYCu711]|uniref:universal stress protein n=1 Tax=Mucilaginibacter sp. UYCu711 TaxID=3156339 RepID=UPI003D252CA7